MVNLQQGGQGPMLCFLNIFAEKIGENIGVFAQTTATFCKNVIITLVFEKNANFFAENGQNSQKIVIITSTPDWENFRLSSYYLLWLVENYRSSPKFSLFSTIKGTHSLRQKIGWATFWAIFSPTHLVTLVCSTEPKNNNENVAESKN
jgi:hypothetical protein